MKRVAWLTDLHLNFLETPAIVEFLHTVAAADPGAVMIGGDIGDAPHLLSYLDLIEDVLRRPIFFVLGNHDYYHSSIDRVRQQVTALNEQAGYLTYLPAEGIVALGPDVALIGHGGWGDGRLGDFLGTNVILNDFLLIDDLKLAERDQRLAVQRALGDGAAAYVRDVLPRALADSRRVIFLTHVPPFEDACWHGDGFAGDDFLPFFACRAVGDALTAIMANHPDRNLLVLCGHTHSPGRAQIRDNLLVLSGSAEYGKPIVQRVFEVAP